MSPPVTCNCFVKIKHITVQNNSLVINQFDNDENYVLETNVAKCGQMVNFSYDFSNMCVNFTIRSKIMRHLQP